MDLYKHLKKDAYDLDETEFVQRHDGCYLFSQMPESKSGPMPFVTQVHKLTAQGQLLAEKEEPSAPPERLWKVEKTERNNWNRRISVGRATNNDIVIRHDSISKLHAHFSAPTPKADALDQATNFLLTDAGSLNGTEVNGDLLLDENSALIRNRDQVVFGQITGHFLDASALHSELNALDWV